MPHMETQMCVSLKYFHLDKVPPEAETFVIVCSPLCSLFRHSLGFNMTLEQQFVLKRRSGSGGWWCYSAAARPLKLFFSSCPCTLMCHCCSTLTPAPPPLDPIYSHLPPPRPHNHPQAWPVSASQSKFKLQHSQLLCQPLWAPVIFPCRGGFFCQRPSASRRGLWLCVRVRGRGEEGREGDGGAHTGSAGLKPRGGL